MRVTIGPGGLQDQDQDLLQLRPFRTCTFLPNLPPTILSHFPILILPLLLLIMLSMFILLFLMSFVYFP
jgi:hypothetical protein